MNQVPNTAVKAETLDATITYIEGLPTGVETQSAVASVEEWAKQLRADGRPELLKVADELQRLKQLLSESTPNGKAIGQVLQNLGALTVQTAPLAEPTLTGRLEKLGKWLTKVGQTL